jgi:hypothetical protein
MFFPSGDALRMRAFAPRRSNSLPGVRGRRAVAAVDDDPDPLEGAREAGEEVDVVGGLVGDIDGLPGLLQPGGDGLAAEELLDGLLGGVGDLEALGGDQLDAVVLGRVVGRGDDDAERAAPEPRERRHAGRGDDAREGDVDAHGLEARREGVFDLGSRRAGVAADDDPSASRALAAGRGLQVAEGLGDRGLEARGVLAEHDARRAGDLDYFVGRKEAVAGAIADAVRTEDVTHRGAARIENRE